MGGTVTGDTESARASVRTPARNDAAPWTFLYLLAVIAFLVAWVGMGTALVVVTVFVNVTFMAFFLRHVAFSCASVRWAPNDLYGVPEVDLEYRPNVSILVA